MKSERKELANLFARYLDGTLADDDTIGTWERLSRSDDPTIVNGCQILTDQIEDTMFDVQLLDKSEWDYIERVRLAILGNATIVKRKSFHFGWRSVLSGFGFFAFVMLAAEYDVGYHLLPATSILAVIIFAFSKLIPRQNSSSPYESIISPFTTFSGLKLAYKNAESFRKHRYTKPTTKQASLAADCFWVLFTGCLMAVLSPVMLLILTLPDTEPKYQAIAG
ncbi:hypothetical protein OAG71_00600 [bacterium]|nr:hypothetical protein [bacterium]